MSRGTACGRHTAAFNIHALMLRGGTISIQGGLLVAGTDGPGRQVILAPMVRGDHLFPT